MSEENKASIHRLVDEVFNGGDLAVVDEIMASSYVHQLALLGIIHQLV